MAQPAMAPEALGAPGIPISMTGPPQPGSAPTPALAPEQPPAGPAENVSETLYIQNLNEKIRIEGAYYNITA